MQQHTLLLAQAASQHGTSVHGKGTAKIATYQPRLPLTHVRSHQACTCCMVAWPSRPLLWKKKCMTETTTGSPAHFFHALHAQACPPLCNTCSSGRPNPLRPLPCCPIPCWADDGILHALPCCQSIIPQCWSCCLCAEMMHPQQTVYPTLCHSLQVSIWGFVLKLPVLF